ncbi:MAG: HD domain-containing protein [Deltaproteobacteria bacterium]|nr:HD domain-containing protein [Deltaproteobacteria bacterium]
MPAENYLRNLDKGVRGLSSRRSLLALADLAAARSLEIYLVGGTVRELVLGRPSPDLDLAVSSQTLDLARDLAQTLGGTFVLLDEKERTARVVWGKEILDLAEFRAPTLEGDLRGRDFTLNALALDLKAVLGRRALELVDPLGGLADLKQGLIRMVAPENLAYDPLRLLRAYRFAATHGLVISPETARAIGQYVALFPRVAGERVHQELFLLLGAPRAAPVLREMDRIGLLNQVLPELADMKGVAQDGFHHLDVFHHALETVAHLEEVLARPQDFFGELTPEVARYAAAAPRPVLLKLAALFHDVGKPQVQERRQDPDRYTFYYHEKVGVEIFTAAALRLRMSNEESRAVVKLIQLHMRPFLLMPLFRRGRLSIRALGRLVRAARRDLPGLFTLAMADSLAAQGSQKPPDSEQTLADLADAAYRFLKERLEPQELQPRLLSGHDLIKVLGLQPGPRFRHLLTAVEEAQWEGDVTTREEALKLVRRLL